MKHKIFIGIDLDPYLKKTLGAIAQKWEDMPIKWHRDSSLHITLVFLGYVEESHLNDIMSRVRTVCERTEIFDIALQEVNYFYKDPHTTNTPKDAGRVALRGEPSEALKNLQADLSKELDIFVADKKEFRPHVTLGRMRKARWQELEVYPEIPQKLEVTMDVSAVTIFDSAIVDGKHVYIPLDVCPLQ